MDLADAFILAATETGITRRVLERIATAVERMAGLPPTPDGTTVPPAVSILDTAGAVWTIAADGNVLRNNLPAAGGAGSRIFWHNCFVYVFGTDSNWWQWTGSTWANVGPVQPA